MHRVAKAQGIVWAVLLGSLTVVGLGVLGDMKSVGLALAGFPLSHLLAALSLAFVNYAVRYVRWEIYLRALGARVGFRQSATVFFAGFAFSVSPGKAGELVKSYLLKQSAGVEVERSAPAVVVERITDFVGVLLLALAGGVSFGYGLRALAAIAALFFLGLVVLVSPFSVRLLRHAFPYRFEAVAQSQEYLRSLLCPSLLVTGLVLAIGAWFAECLAFWWVLRGFGATLPVLSATFVYAFSTLVGAVSFLPGGLLATEGSMAAVLSFLHTTPAVSSAATLVIRVCTLWFAVLLGLGALFAWKRGTKRILP